MRGSSWGIAAIGLRKKDAEILELAPRGGQLLYSVAINYSP